MAEELHQSVQTLVQIKLIQCWMPRVHSSEAEYELAFKWVHWSNRNIMPRQIFYFSGQENMISLVHDEKIKGGESEIFIITIRSVMRYMLLCEDLKRYLRWGYSSIHDALRGAVHGTLCKNVKMVKLLPRQRRAWPGVNITSMRELREPVKSDLAQCSLTI